MPCVIDSVSGISTIVTNAGSASSSDAKSSVATDLEHRQADEHEHGAVA